MTEDVNAPPGGADCTV